MMMTEDDFTLIHTSSAPLTSSKSLVFVERLAKTTKMLSYTYKTGLGLERERERERELEGGVQLQAACYCSYLGQNS